MRSALLCAAAVLSVSVALQADVQAAAQDAPNLTFIDQGWLLDSGGTDFLPPQAGELGPISNDPKYPHVGNNQGGQPTERIANIADPNLKPWAADVMKKQNELTLAGKRGFVAQSRCWPGGVPAQLLFPAEPVFFIQTPKEVWMIWQRDAHVRRIYLDRPHSKNPKPAWFGESVGRYENGELVVDTIGIAERPNSYVDNYRTPHTKNLHVVERFRVTENGNRLEARIRVDDPGTFNKPWSAQLRWRKVNRGSMIESICAENNGANFFHLDEWPMPEAVKAEF